MSSIRTPPITTKVENKETGSHLSLSLFSHKRHTPLLTAVYTKPQSVTTSQISPVYSTPNRNRPPSILHEVSRLSFGSYSPAVKVDKEVPKAVSEADKKEENTICTTTHTQAASADAGTFRGGNGHFSVAGNLSDPNAGLKSQSSGKTNLFLDSLEKQIFAHESGEPVPTQSKLTECFSLSATPAASHKYPPVSYKESQDSNKYSLNFARPRSHNSSICSNFSGDVDSVLAHSRCSSCDGCSSDDPCTLVNPHHQACVCEMDTVDASYIGSQRRPLSDSALQHLSDSEYTQKEITRREGIRTLQEETSLPKSWTYDTHKCVVEEGGCGKKSDQADKLALSNEQLIFLLLRLQLTKYRSLIEDVSEQKLISKSQQKSIACLIQAVFTLTKRNQLSAGTLHHLQLEIRQLQDERRTYVKQQRRTHLCVCVLVGLYLINISAVRRRLIAVVKFFGIVETAKKINRTRRMIADNWRNIPSLLTDFWQIFIFRSSSTLNANYLR